MEVGMTYGARAIAAARDHLTTGKSVKAITAETGLRQSVVSNGMMVLRFVPELVGPVCAGTMSLSEARQRAHDVKASQRRTAPATPRKHKRATVQHHEAAMSDDRRMTWITDHWARMAADNRGEDHYEVGHCYGCARAMHRHQVTQVMGANDMAGWQCLLCGGEIDPTWTPF
jgi:hypothetical protein